MSAFDHIEVQTTQNVKLLYEVSAVGDRLLAYLIDYIIMAGMCFFIWIAYDNIIGFGTEMKTVTGILTIISPLLFYHPLLEIFNNGQSIGKKIMKIKVIRLDGTEPTLGNYIIRWLTRILEMQGVFGLSLIVILINGKGQRLGDIAAGTTVAKVKKRVSLQDTILAFEQKGYEPQYPQVKNLSSKDIEVIKEAIHYHEKYNNFQVINACGMKVKTLFGMDPNSTAVPNEQFLRTVVNDFTYYKSEE